MSKKPADGERSAASGYRAQYLVGASVVLGALESGDLEWIRVADPNIGRVDDLQVATTARVDAYQVKWEQYVGAITYNDLTQEKASSPPLFAQLADGWSRLKELYPSRRVVVHLVTNQYASSSSRGSMPETASPPSPYHIAAFIGQAWKPAQSKGTVELSGLWEPVWKEIQRIVNLSLDDFIEFVMDCSLDFRVSLPEKTEDIISISDLLFNTAASPERLIEMTRDELISRLGWRQRYSTWNTHEFPEPKYTYRPIQNTVDNLKSTLDELKGGYIGVFGSPGSGKSTLLTQTLRTLPIRLIRYYAYVPDSQDPSAVRGESINFLHDVTLKLTLAGFKGDGPSDPTDRIGMLNLFNEQISSLGADCQNTDEKTIILIDGLDHIAREQHPDRSLLHDLPLPQEIPDGVYIILGSQTDDLLDLPKRVLQELKKRNRRAEMGKFTPTDTRIIASSAMPDLCEEENQKIFELSDGHPLALIYLLKEIQQISDAKERLEFLGESNQFEGDIEDQYWSHWHKFKEDEELRFALGLLSRTRGPIPMGWVATWAETSVLRKIQKLFLTYFEKDSQDRWIFFHNSFRLFLIARTSEPLPGQTKEQQNQALHLELAHKYEKKETPWCWEALYHYFFAGDHRAVVALATWEWFLQQATSLRPLDAVQTDIRLALKSAGKCKDTVLLARLTLIGAAIQQRIRVLEEFPLTDLLLSCGEFGLAADHLRDGNRLRVNIEQALNTSVDLFRAGLKREAQRVFELSEPHELLSGRLIQNDHTRPQDLWEILQAWVSSAIPFRDVLEIVETIRRIRVSPRWNDTGDIETESRELQDWLIFQGALACCEWNDWDSWQIFFAALEDEQDQTMRMFTLLRSMEYDQKFLPELLSTYPPNYFETIDSDQWSTEGRISFAELLSKIEEHKQKANTYIESLKPIPLYDQDLGYDEKPIQQKLRFRLARLRYFLGESRSPSQMLEDSEANTNFPQHTKEEKKKGYRHVALATYTAARLWAWGRSGKQLSPTSFIQETKWIIELFGPKWDDLSISARLYLSGSRYNVLNCVILAAIQHGKDVLNAVKDDFEGRWLDSEKGAKWRSGLQRKIINSFVRAGIDQGWAREQLIRISPTMLYGLDPYSRVEECKAQAEAWLLIDKEVEATKALNLMVDAAGGIRSEKDYQLSEWVQWLGRVNEYEPNKQQERIRCMIRRIVSVKGVASGVTSAAVELLSVVFLWSPQKSILLLKAMLEADLVGFEAGVIKILYTALKSVDSPCEEIKQIVLNLIFPFSQNSEPKLLEKLLISEARQEGIETAQDTAQELINQIGIHVLSKNRFEWVQGVLDGLEKIGISQDQVSIGASIFEEKEEQNPSQLDRHLFLIDGEKISPSKAKTFVNSIEELNKLLENEDTEKTQYFDWVEIVEHLVPLLESQGDLERIQNLVSPKLSEGFSAETSISRLHIALSKGYENFNNNDLAWKHAEQALENSNPSGWVTYWDGGIRLKALQQLKAIDPKRTYEFIFDLYANDLSERSYYPTSFILHLQEILELMSVELPVSEIWHEIENYLNDLFVCEDFGEMTELETVLDEPTTSFGKDVSRLAIINILLLFLTFPSYPIAQGSVRALSELLLNNGEPVVDLFDQTLLSSNDLLVERMLMVLVAIRFSENHLDIINGLRDKLNKFCVSQNFAIRLFACMTIAQNGNFLQKLGTNKIQLPPIYQLHLPNVSFHTTWQSKEREQNPILVGDLARRLRPLDEEFRVIARISNLPIDNLLYRAEQLFETFLIDRIWLNDEKPVTENRLRAFLNNVGVWTSHSKPHIFAARQALAYVIAELWDCGYLEKDMVGTIQVMLTNFDSEFIVQKPSERPRFIIPIGNQDNKSYDLFPDNWVEDAKESFQFLHTKTDDGLFILGERTKLKFLQEDWPTEERFSVVKGKKANIFWSDSDIDKGHTPFFRKVNILAQQYSSIQASTDQFVISNEAYGYETPGADWLALNPMLGRELGWNLDSGGWFQWVDVSGNIVAKSIWWRDGSIELYNRFARIEVAEGWLVLVSKSGLEEIRNHFSTINRGCVVNRRIGWLGNKGAIIAKQITSLK